MVLTDEVIWYCEDCEIEVIDVDFSDNAIADLDTEVSFSDDCDLNSGDSENVEVEDCNVEVIDADNSDNEIEDSENIEVEDCEVEEVIDIDSSDIEITDSKNTEVNSVEDCDQETADSVKVEVELGYEYATVADSQPIADSIWRYEVCFHD